MKVVLTMIVKDEEHVIKRALHSCVGMIDAYCIIDTGSTDKTKEIINYFFSKHKHIKGEIIDFPFTTFEECRNKSIEHGKKYGDYGFWIDADEELILNDTWNRNDFKKNLIKDKPDQVLFNCYYPPLNYNRSQMFRFDADYTWYGPVHEVLKSDKENQTATEFPYGKVLIKAEGNSWKTADISKKYEEHANILLDYQIKNNWEDTRWTFYLAQSYKDAALPLLMNNPKDERGLDLGKKAINFYRDRTLNIEGFNQEMYYSQLMIARISHFFNTVEYSIYEFLKCEEFNWDNRVEHINDLLTIYRNKELWRNGKIIADLGHSIIQNGGTSSTLFIESDIYQWRFYDNFAVILYFNRYFEESIKVADWILSKSTKLIPIEDVDRINNNKRLAQEAMDKHKRAHV